MLSEDPIRRTRSAYYVVWGREKHFAEQAGLDHQMYERIVCLDIAKRYEVAITTLDNVLEERSDVLQGYET